MKFSVKVMKGGKWGEIVYDDANQKLEVTFDGAGVSQIEAHFRKETEFRIPTSDRIDDYKIVKVYPTSAIGYMELALCSLYSDTGFWVEWSTIKKQQEA